MVEYITGINGIGKTRVLTEAAAATAQNSNGNVIFIDCSNKLRFEMPSRIRLINTSDYGIGSSVALYGFIAGLCAGDYDLTDVFVDSTMNIISNNQTSINDFMDIMTGLSDKTGVDFHFSVSDSEEKEIAYRSVV